MLLFETARDGVEARAVAGRGSPLLVVVFSQVRVPSGHFGLSRLFARTTHACLFLNQPENDWYRGAEAAVDAAIARALDASGASRLVLYGSSMGAFGAAAATARWPSADAVLFAPDYRIGEPESRSSAAGLRERAGEPTLADHLAAPGAGRIDVAFGLFDPHDAGVAARLHAAPPGPRVRLVPLASVHEVHDQLYSLNVIRAVIAGFSRDLAAEAARRGLAPDVADFAPYARLAALSAALGAGEAVDPAAVAGLGLSGNPGAALLEAEAHETRGDLTAAADRLAALDAEILADPRLAGLPKRYRKTVPRRRIALLRQLGRFDEAVAVEADAAARFPTDEGFTALPRPPTDD